MNQSLLVTKRDGSTERINLDKIHRVLDWAAEGLNNVSISQVELRSHIQFYDGIKTADIHETIIKAAADLISREAPDYQYLAARLAIFHLRKKAYGQFEPPALYDHVTKMVKKANTILICWKTTRKKSSSRWIRSSFTIAI
jgi:ribonucleoside-diphosphate reductase alpha chain